MKIQFNTDKTVNGEERNENHFASMIESALKRFESHITRVEVHLSDENGKKDGFNDMKCSLEARVEGRKPVVVTCQAEKPELAVSGAIEKLKSALDTIIGKLQEH
jgi:ribosome-associated translation inhibitor RaiA